MKKLIIAGGVLALLYYTWSRTSAPAASTATTANGASNLNNPAAMGQGNNINLTGPSYSTNGPGVASVS